jgi:transposase-like protein
MKQGKFTDQQREILLQNTNILKVGDSQVTYSPKFKLKAIKEYNGGKSPIQIFTDAGINIEILGRKIPKRCIGSWKKIVKTHGEAGLLKGQRGKSPKGCRPQIKELTLEEKIKILEAKNAYLEAENDFLKKLKTLKGGLI